MRRRGSILLLGESGPRRRGKPNFSLPPGTNTSDVTHAASGAAVGFHQRYKKRRVGIAFCSPVYGHLALASWALPLGIPARSPSCFELRWLPNPVLCLLHAVARRVERVLDLYPSPHPRRRGDGAESRKVYCSWTSMSHHWTHTPFASRGKDPARTTINRYGA